MIALIAAVAENGVIGSRGHIPWHIPGEQKRFKELTTGHTVLMGRLSYEEIGHPLPDRGLRVLSTTKRFEENGVKTFPSLPAALYDAGERDIYFAGGGQVYREGLPLCERLYITEVASSPEGDTFFPPFDAADYEKREEPWVDAAIPYRYVTYIRKKK